MYTTSPTVKTVMTALGKKCKAIRKHKKLTQVQLANASQVSLSSLKRFENNGMIALESLLRISAVLGRLDDFSSVFALDEIDLNIKSKFDV